MECVNEFSSFSDASDDSFVFLEPSNEKLNEILRASDDNDSHSSPLPCYFSEQTDKSDYSNACDYQTPEFSRNFFNGNSSNCSQEEIENLAECYATSALSLRDVFVNIYNQMKNVKDVSTERRKSANDSVQEGQSYSLSTNESSEDKVTNHSSSVSGEQTERKCIEDHSGSNTNSANDSEESFAATVETNCRFRPRRKKLCRDKFFYSSVLFFVAAISVLLFALASSHKTALDCYKTIHHTAMEMERIAQDIKLEQKELKSTVLLMQNDAKEEFLLKLESILHKILLFNYLSLQKNSATMQDPIAHQRQHMTEEMLLMVKQFKYTERAKSTDQDKLHESINYEYSLKIYETEYPEKVDKLIPSEEKFVSYAYQQEHITEEIPLIVKKLKYVDAEGNKSTDLPKLHESIDHEYSKKNNESEYPGKVEKLISTEENFVSHVYQQEHMTEKMPLMVKKNKYIDVGGVSSTDQSELHQFFDHEYSLKNNETEYLVKVEKRISIRALILSFVFAVSLMHIIFKMITGINISRSATSPVYSNFFLYNNPENGTSKEKYF